jgi:hypothetical protein
MDPSGTCGSGSDSDLSPFDPQSNMLNMGAQMGNRFTLDTDYIDELASDLESRYWENKPPENWTSEDVWHWIFSWAGDRSVDVEEVQPLAYSNMTGQQLCGMSRNDFVNLNPKYGGHIFETLQQLSNQFREFRKLFSLRRSKRPFLLSHSSAFADFVLSIKIPDFPATFFLFLSDPSHTQAQVHPL